MNKKAKRFTSVLLTVLMALSMFMTSFATPANGFENIAELSGAEAVSEVVAAEAAEEQAEQTAAPAEEIAEVQEEELLGASPVYIGFTSDVHGNTSQLEKWLDKVTDTVSMENMGYCGDYSYSSGNSYLNEFNKIVSLTNQYVGTDKGVYTTGNHCWMNGGSSVVSSMEKTTGFVRLGEATNVNTDAYKVYGFGAANNSKTSSAAGNFPDSDIEALEEYLKNVNSKIPVFILAHYPLHYYSSRSSENADDVIDMLNKYPNAVFVWGHNHSQGDSHYNEVKTFGDSIEYKSGSSKQINFTYISAGSVYSSSQVSHGGTIVKVDGTKLTVTDYKYDGTPLTIKNKNTDALTVDIKDGTSGGSGSDTPGTDPVPSTTTVEITPSTDHPTATANIKVGESVTVNLTNGSSSSDYDFEITSNDTGVARPSTGSINVAKGKTGTFTIAGVSAGSATIEITNNNGGSGSSWGGWGGSSSSYERVATITVNVTGSGSDTPGTDPDVPSTTEITVAPTTDDPEYNAAIKAGEILSVNIYYESENTSDNSWTFTLTSENESVAKVEGAASVTLSNKQTGTVKVKGVNEGTVTLKIENNNTEHPEYTRYATVYLTVNAAQTEPDLTSIAITTAPTKTVYTAGESFSTAGMVVTGTYTGGYTKQIEEYTVSPSGALSTSDKEVVIEYQGKTASQPITVNAPQTEPELMSIAITTAPTKTVYTAGESFSTAGMVVTGTYTGGYTKPIEKYTVSPSGALSMSDEKVVIEYQGRTASQPITVNPKQSGGQTNVYLITFKLPDGTEKYAKVDEGVKPTYPGSTDPVKAADIYNTYKFAGWSPELTEATEDAEYTAQFTPEARYYTITWIVNGVSTSVQVKAGDVPSYNNGKDPASVKLGGDTYNFNGWNPAIQKVTGNQIYEAQYTKAGTTTGGGSTSGGGSGSSGGGVSGGVATAGGPTSAKGATATYSGNWYTDAAGIWRIKNNAGQVVANAWLCDDAIAANGQNVWYLLNADGSMIINGLVQDNTGNFYSIETNHNGYYGMLRYQDGYYDCNGTQVYLQFSRAHNGTFGAIINAEGLAALQAIYGVTKFGVDNSNCVYTSKF